MPWGFASTRAYYPGTFGWLLVSWLVIAAALWLGAFAVVRARIGKPLLAVAWIVAVTMTSVVVEAETAVIAVAALFLVVEFGDRADAPLSASVLALTIASPCSAR